MGIIKNTWCRMHLFLSDFLPYCLLSVSHKPLLLNPELCWFKSQVVDAVTLTLQVISLCQVWARHYFLNSSEESCQVKKISARDLWSIYSDFKNPMKVLSIPANQFYSLFSLHGVILAVHKTVLCSFFTEHTFDVMVHGCVNGKQIY